MPGYHIPAILPHRSPFLFIDEIVEVGDETAHCRLRLPDGDGSHAPRMFAELVVVEALAQTAAVHVGVTGPDEGPAVGLLGGIEGLTFAYRPRAGDQLDLYCRRTRRLGPIAMYDVRASRADRELCRGTLTVRSGGVP